MERIFKIEMLPAEYGDCLWIEYGTKDKVRRILIDGGTPETYPLLSKRIADLPVNERHFELLIVTHVDADHISGILKLLQDEKVRVVFKDIWFNGWKHLSGLLTPVDGEYLSSLLEEGNYNWNAAFAEEAVVLKDSESLPKVILDDDFEITLLTPTEALLERLRDKWVEVVTAARLAPGDSQMALKRLRNRQTSGDILLSEVDIEALAKQKFSADRSVANGSSISILINYNGKTCLLAGDAFSSSLTDSLKLLPEYSANKKVKLDAFKLPHHGSQANISAKLLELIDCSKYLFSTNGKRFSHPNPAAVARVILYGGENVTLCFNYRTDFTERWEDEKSIEKYKYKTLFPQKGCEGLSIYL